MVQPFEMETQAGAGTEQGAAAVRWTPEGSAAGAERTYRFDRDALLREKKGYWMVRRAQDIFFSLLALIVLAVPHGDRGAGDLDRQPRGKPPSSPRTG